LQYLFIDSVFRIHGGGIADDVESDPFENRIFAVDKLEEKIQLGIKQIRFAGAEDLQGFGGGVFDPLVGAGYAVIDLRQ
jgi:hypothetical protein